MGPVNVTGLGCVEREHVLCEPIYMKLENAHSIVCHVRKQTSGCLGGRWAGGRDDRAEETSGGDEYVHCCEGFTGADVPKPIKLYT